MSMTTKTHPQRLVVGQITLEDDDIRRGVRKILAPLTLQTMANTAFSAFELWKTIKSTGAPDERTGGGTNQLTNKLEINAARGSSNSVRWHLCENESNFGCEDVIVLVLLENPVNTAVFYTRDSRTQRTQLSNPERTCMQFDKVEKLFQRGEPSKYQDEITSLFLDQEIFTG
jgi:hypothetical protein